MGQASHGTPSAASCELDSFAACVQRATSYWGQPASYDCVATLSGVAFAPTLPHKASCPACWMEFNSDLRMDFLAHSLGFSVLGSTPAATCCPSSDGRDHMELGEFCERARASVPRAGVLLIGPSPRWHLYTNWPEDIEAAMEPQACHNLNRLPDLTRSTRLYLLRPHEPALTRAEATREALQFGAAASLGRLDSDTCGFGGAFYREMLQYLADLTGDEFCRNGKQEAGRCLQRRFQRSSRACRTAAQFLRKAETYLPGIGDNRHLRDAVRAFGTMATELTRNAALVDGPGAEKHALAARLKRIGRIQREAATELDALCSWL